MRLTEQIKAIVLNTKILTALLCFFGTFTATANSASQTLFTTQVPSQVGQSDGTGVNYELGTLLRSNTTGQIAAIRFWKDAKESGTHTGHIWSRTGQVLASVAFANETASGWQQQALTTPLAIVANTTYVVSVNTGNTFYVDTASGLASQVINGSLISVVGNDGVYGGTGKFPTSSWQKSNYFRDVVFVPVTGSVIAPTITSQPSSETVIAGQRATFTVVASGTAPMTYQWTKNAGAISGATSSSYTTPAEVTSDTNALFGVVVANSMGSATSASAALTVTAATLILNSSASSLAFGNVNTSSSATLSVTLTNAGNSSVTVLSVSLSGAGFSASGVSGGVILPPGRTATVTATFSPSAAGIIAGNVTVTSNATNSPDSIALSGTGVALVSRSASLSWTASTSVVVGYNVYSSRTSGGPYTQLTSSPSIGTSYIDSTVQAGLIYYYVVTAVASGDAESVFSSEISAVIP
jgi:hypothetical protein